MFRRKSHGCKYRCEEWSQYTPEGVLGDGLIQSGRQALPRIWRALTFLDLVESGCVAGEAREAARHDRSADRAARLSAKRSRR